VVYLPFYAILALDPNKLAGVAAMFSASPGSGVPALARYSPDQIVEVPAVGETVLLVFVIVCLLLGLARRKPARRRLCHRRAHLTFCYSPIS